MRLVHNEDLAQVHHGDSIDSFNRDEWLSGKEKRAAALGRGSEAPECGPGRCAVVGKRILHGARWRCCNCEAGGPVVMGLAVLDAKSMEIES